MDKIPFHTHNGVDSPKIRIKFGDLVIDRQPAISNPSGGTVIDTEARAAINDILETLRHFGLIEE